MFKVNKTFYFLGALVVSFIFGFLNLTVANAKSNSTIPTELRGSWYQFDTKGYAVLAIYKHEIKTWQINKNGHRVSKKSIMLSSKASGAKKLYVSKSISNWNKHRYMYDMVNAKKQPDGAYSDGLEFWTFTKRIGNKRYRVLGTYQRQGWVDAYSNNKIKHDFSYTSKTLKELGYKK